MIIPTPQDEILMLSRVRGDTGGCGGRGSDHGLEKGVLRLER
jgi:hypothetical protein